MDSTSVHQLLDEALTPLDMIKSYLNFVKENHVKPIPVPTYAECDFSDPLKFIDVAVREYPSLTKFQLLYIYITDYKTRPGKFSFTTNGLTFENQFESSKLVRHLPCFNATVEYISKITSPSIAIFHDDYRRNIRLQQTVTLYSVLFK